MKRLPIFISVFFITYSVLAEPVVTVHMKDRSVIRAQTAEYFGSSYLLVKGENREKRIPMNQIADFELKVDKETTGGLQCRIRDLIYENKRLKKENESLRRDNESLKVDIKANAQRYAKDMESEKQLHQAELSNAQAVESEKKLHQAIAKYSPEWNALPLRVVQAEFKKADTLFLRENYLDLVLRNDGDQAISKADFKLTLCRLGRAIPDFEDSFSFDFQGGIEPGEVRSFSLAPNMFLSPKWHSVELMPGMFPVVDIKRIYDKDGKSVRGTVTD